MSAITRILCGPRYSFAALWEGQQSAIVGKQVRVVGAHRIHARCACLRRCEAVRAPPHTTPPCPECAYPGLSPIAEGTAVRVDATWSGEPPAEQASAQRVGRHPTFLAGCMAPAPPLASSPVSPLAGSRLKCPARMVCTIWHPREPRRGEGLCALRGLDGLPRALRCGR